MSIQTRNKSKKKKKSTSSPGGTPPAPTEEPNPPTAPSTESQQRTGSDIASSGTRAASLKSDDSPLNFDKSLIYEDDYSPEQINFDTSTFNISMDPALRSFLLEVTYVKETYLDELLAWNGVRDYEDFKRLFVDKSNFEDLDHIYQKLGPNALGLHQVETERLVYLGYYISSARIEQEGGGVRAVTIYDPKTKVFMPQSFDRRAWNSNFITGIRTFHARFKTASGRTFSKYRGDLHVTHMNPPSIRSISRIETIPDEIPSKTRNQDPDGESGFRTRYATRQGRNGGDPDDSDPSSSESDSEDTDDDASDEDTDASNEEDSESEDDDDSGSDSGSKDDGSGDDSDEDSEDKSTDSDGTDDTMPKGWGTPNYKVISSASSAVARAKKYAKISKKRAAKSKPTGGGKGGSKHHTKYSSNKPAKCSTKTESSKSSLKKRSVLTIPKWNGITPFENTFNHIRNFVEQQTGMHYIVDESFVSLYRKKKHRKYLKTHNISKEQFRSDNRTLHAYLSSAFENYVASRNILWKYRKQKHGPDGVKAYYRLYVHFSAGGDARDLLLNSLVTERNAPYQAGKKGGLTAYVERFQYLCAEIDRCRSFTLQYGRTNRKKSKKELARIAKQYDSDKGFRDLENCSQLLVNIGREPTVEAVYTSAYHMNTTRPGNFEALCTHIKAMDQSIHNPYATTEANRIRRSNARLLTASETEQGERDIFGMLASGNSNDLNVPKALWQAMDPEMRDKLVELRRSIRSKTTPKDTSTVETPKIANTASTRQANLALLGNEHLNIIDEESLTDGSVDPDPPMDEDEREVMEIFASYVTGHSDASHYRRAATLRMIRCDTEVLERSDIQELSVYASLGSVSKAARTTCDGGADTYIVGNGYRTNRVHEGLQANVFGFDSKFASKLGLPIGDADCVIIGYLADAPDKPMEFIGRVHYAVINEGCPTSLMSELQSRDNGAIIDTVRKGHVRDMEGNLGTQQMVFPVKEGILGDEETKIVVPLVLKRGLMTFECRYPEDVDYSELPIVSLTADEPWDPSKYNEDDGFIRDAAGIPRSLSSFGDFRVAENANTNNGGMETDSDDVMSCDATGDNVSDTTMHGDEHDTPGTQAHPDTLDPTSPTLLDVDNVPHDQDRLESRGEQSSHASRNHVQDSFASESETILPYVGQDISTLRGDDTISNVETTIEPDDETKTWFFDDGFMESMELATYHANTLQGDTSNRANLNVDFAALQLRADIESELGQIGMHEFDHLLDNMEFEDLIGAPFGIYGSATDPTTRRASLLTTKTQPFDSYSFLATANKNFRDSEISQLRPNFAYRPVDIIRKTLENTTQFAKSFSPFPLHKHWRAMYKFHNHLRLQETVCMDTVFVNVPCIGTGATCMEVYYGVKSHMINSYGMHTKSQAHDTYRDFLRDEGIPLTLHRDNSGEQNDTRFRDTNRELRVRDSFTEPYHPHQNPAETRAIRFLKRAGRALITLSGAPVETWFYAMKYACLVNNWTSHESLKWKTPYEKRHGVQPDISPLLAFRFFEPVYYYVDEGFPDSGERLGYVLGVNENVGSHMTFDILTDDKQTVIPRSVLRKIGSPTVNHSLVPSEDLDPQLRIKDRGTTNELDDDDRKLPALVPQRATDRDVAAAGQVLGEQGPPKRDLRARQLEEPPIVPQPRIFMQVDEGPPVLHPNGAAVNFERHRPRLVVEDGFAVPDHDNLRPPEFDWNEFLMDDDLEDVPELIGRDHPDHPLHGVPALFVNEPLPMHNRRPRRGRKRPTGPVLPVAEDKRKEKNDRDHVRTAPSNKRRKKKKIVRSNSSKPTDDVTAQQEFVIDDIVSHRKNPSTGEIEVLIAWEGYDDSENSWEPMSNIRETAEETLQEYAVECDLTGKPGWEWTRSPDLNDVSSTPLGDSNLKPTPSRGATKKSTATVIPPNPAPVEGGSRRTRSQTKAARQSNTAKTDAPTKPKKPTSAIPTLINNVSSILGIPQGDGKSNGKIKNYIDFDDNELKKPLPPSDIPLETVIYDDPTQDVSANMAKILEIQGLDKMEEGDDEWTIVKVLKHATRRVSRRLPKTRSQQQVIKDKHTRLLVMFMDGDMKWIALDAALLQDPVPIIEYVKRNKLTNNKQFEAVREIMRNEEKMGEYRRAFKAKVSKAPVYHFGVEVPRSPTHASHLDKVNGNTLWADATKKELDSINKHKVFRLATKDDDLSSFKRIPYSFVFDVKHDGRRKTRLVAGGHVTDPPASDVYSGVVGMDTVRLAFAVGAMQGLDVCACDISTAFLYGKTKEKVYIVAGPEFGPELEGKKLIVQGNWYGLKSAAATYHSVASAVLRKMGFRPTKVDADLWMRKKDDHYEYLAIYVDDLLAWGKRPLEIIKEVEASFKLQGIGFPDYYLGADVNPVEEKHLVENGYALGLSAKTYIKNALHKLEKLFDDGPFKKATTPMVETYHPESDDTKLLGPEDITRYRALLGSANWIVTLGRFDIAYATSTLARYSMAPREGHLLAMKRIFGYLRNYPQGELLINPKPFDHGKSKGIDDTWKEYYPDATEELPPDQPEPLPRKAQITIYVDADHAHDTVTRRSVTGIMIFVNQTLVKYVSKRQKTVETSSYGSELVAARMATELAMEYRYSLRMLGVEIDGPCRMFGDNNSVILNTTMPSSMLKKKHQSIAYHATRMAQASGVLSFEHVRSEDNWADILTKPLSRKKFHELVKPLLFRRSGGAAALQG